MMMIFDTLKEKSLGNIVGKGENAGNQHFLLFPQCFLPYKRQTLFLSNNEFGICICFQFGFFFLSLNSLLHNPDF